MINDAASAARMVDRQLRGRGVADERVLAAMERVPRHEFVRPADRRRAYEDRALPTEEGQTISQPYIVAFMTELLHVKAGLKVLEIGAGSGYQSAVLAEMGARVTGIERMGSLARTAANRLERLGYGPRVQIVEADGSMGYLPNAPYDRIMVTAAAPHLFQGFTDQLAKDGRLVIPIGPMSQQHLYLYQRCPDGWLSTRHLPCRFVPLLGREAFEI